MNHHAPESTAHYTDYDSPWKEMLEHNFKEFLAFFFPVVHEGIDWTEPYQFLDKELQQIVRDAELGRRLVDKLVKVSTSDGEETWVVVHVEVQGQYESDFAKLVYYYRLFDRYNRDVVSLAVLADGRKHWKPTRFQKGRWGCDVRLTFPFLNGMASKKGCSRPCWKTGPRSPFPAWRPGPELCLPAGPMLCLFHAFFFSNLQNV